MIKLYVVYDVTEQKVALNYNRANPYYSRLAFAKRGLDAFRFKYPNHTFEIHEYTLVKSEVIKE